MDHAATTKLYPAAVATNVATFAIAKDTAGRKLKARLGKRKVERLGFDLYILLVVVRQPGLDGGDQMTGVTVMYMAEGLDTGDILLTRSLPIRRRETAGSLHDRLAKLGPEALAPALDLILSQQAPRIPQDKSQASYAPKLESESGIINWSQDCWHLDRLVRAMDPWPGAFTLVHAADDTVRKLKVHRALPIHRFAGEPGVVIRVGTRGIVVACGNGALLLLEVQLEGKRRMAATEFVRGFALPVGTALGK